MSSSSSKPLRYGMVLFQGFQALDVFGPLDALNSLSQFIPELELYLIAETLDPVSTLIPASITTAPTDKSPSPFAQSLVPTHTFSSPPPVPLDVLIVPGGWGTRDQAIASACTAYIEQVYTQKTLRYLLTVCTGSLLVASAPGIVGKDKDGGGRLELVRTRVEWVKKARWVVDDRAEQQEGQSLAHAPVWSASGVSAGIDMVFAFMAHVYGEETSKKVADYIEYERHTDPSWDPYADIYGLA
ncbi:class I glutamine amidotransferase-like protein [Agrocybe pediades]|nr:class I glutamine amidotransferase-like protein [Agrocybe pediades]